MSFTFNQGYPGGNNTYVPTLELSGNLMVAFSRNVKRYPVTRYAGITPVKQPRGAYMIFNPNDQVRLRNAPHGSKWAPGTPRPTGFHNTLGFQVQTYTTERHNFPTTLDQRSVDIANWPILKSHTEALAQQAMTERSFYVCQIGTTTGNYPAANVYATGTALGGGALDSGTTANPVIYNAFSNAALQIMTQTAGRIKRGDIFALMNAKTATRLSRSREIREYLMQNPESFRNIQMKQSDGWSNNYGLPDELYTTKVIVEDLFYNGNNRTGTTVTDANSPVMPDNTILFGVREQDLESAEGAASYSTLQVFLYEDMTVESDYDKRNRLVYLDVVDEYVPQVAAPPTGVLCNLCFT